MKKYIAAIAAVAVVGTAGVMYVSDKMDTENPDDQPTTSTSSTYHQSEDDYTESDKSGEGSSETDEPESTSADKKEHTFDAEIRNVSDTGMNLSVDKNSEEYNSADKIFVSFGNVSIVDSDGNEVKADDVENFTDVTITYDGNIMETYPAQVKASKITLRNRTGCNVYFCLPDGRVIDTVKIPVGSDIESADMPNAGAYCDDGYHFEGWTYNGETVHAVSDVESSISLIAKIGKD